MKICFYTATRAEYGILKPIMRMVQARPNLTLQIIAGGTHYAPAFGETYRTIEADGFRIDAAAPMDTGDDTPTGILRAIGQTVTRVGSAIQKLGPDALVLLGDRYELVAAAQAATICRVPIVHLFGGESTRGAFDEQFRHAITKMAHIHCAPTDEAAARIRQMGENPRDVFVTGHPALEGIAGMDLMDRTTLGSSLGMALDGPVYAFCYHPETLSDTQDIDCVLEGVTKGIGDASLVMTQANADPGHAAINARLQAFAASRPRTGIYPSLGQQRYYSLLKIANALIGNSSSGIHEAPSFGLYTVNIGGRQDGRTRATSVIDVPANADAIAAALAKCKERPREAIINPYAKDNACALVLAAIESLRDKADILRKTFHSVKA
ncbi:MAG: UDP-N-acetylglucosamine 2-epimerase (hydrolyzing) [Alphaproteobacteria bacterium]|nr:UDP-N-acetylglucosamine 2-epimerase (hydrolyzing) [Alphaproteobacteria bacterium]